MTEIKKFSCVTCSFSTISNANLQKHFESKKHIKKIQSPEIVPTDFQCKKCNKYYSVSSGLWKHNKVCKSITVEQNVDNNSINNKETNINQKILEEIIRMNEIQEARMDKLINNQTMMMENLKQNQLTTTTTIQPAQMTINNTTINNTFNMNIFLEEKCGQAINFDDFIKHLIFENADASKMIGSYVEGTCNIIQRNLEELPLNRRPLHYLVGEDPHQNLIHIRQDDKWNINSELNWMQQIHADDDDTVVNKNPIYYALKKIDDDKLGYLAYYFNQNKEYMLQHGRLVREISRPDFKEKVYQQMMKMITLDINNLDDIDVKSKITNI
jgi:hypothetical protein